MKKSFKFHFNVHVWYFLLLLIISACGVYYSLYHGKIWQQSLGKAKIVGDREVQEGLREIGNITVEISGFVANPNVYTMNAGDTVAKLVDMAGGFLEEADVDTVDLSAKVFHMQEIYIGNTEKSNESRYSQVLVNLNYPPTKKEAELIAESQKININKANSEELIRLPGVGPKLAESIVRYRNEHGDFQTIEALKEVPKIGEKTFLALSKYITVNDEES